MRPRHADVLQGMGFTGSVEEFRETLAAVKAELFASISDEDLVISKDDSARYCVEVRRRLNSPRLTRSIVLKGLFGIRKNRRARAAR